MAVDSSLGDGVFYAMEDYAGGMRRAAIVIIDAVGLFLIGVLLWVPISTIAWSFDQRADPNGVFQMCWCLFGWLYMAVLKRTKIRTLGYLLTGMKVVSTRGKRPTLFAMTLRMLMWVYGPFYIAVDMAWLGADSEQQTLRDCYAGTYVVRNDAKPIGSAPMHLARYCGGGLNPTYPRVSRPFKGN